jgi:ring-1,2-phenylacetyl-CoA epoxidase subunit PaaE
MTPAGRFTLPSDPGAARTHLAIAAGSGITPILSIVRTVLAREPKSRVTLLYGNRDGGSILFKGALEDLKDRHLGRLAVLHVLSREPRGMPLLDGRIDATKLGAVLERVVPAATIDHAFLCGPWGLMEEARAVLRAHGLPPERVHAELFTPAGPASARPAASVAGAGHVAEAALILDGRRHRLGLLAGETIVEAAHRAGIEAPYACKGGMCCTCRARLVEGEVAMATNYGLEPGELAAGFVLACQARPRSDRLVVDFDAA